jgi:hypothetical protein
VQHFWLVLMATAQAQCDRDTTAAVLVMYRATRLSGAVLVMYGATLCLVLMARPSLHNF